MSEKIAAALAECREELRTVEQKLYNLETRYLTETAHVGNIVQGWDRLRSP